MAMMKVSPLERTELVVRAGIPLCGVRGDRGSGGTPRPAQECFRPEPLSLPPPESLLTVDHARFSEVATFSPRAS